MNEEIKIRSILGQTAQKIYKTTGKRVKLEYTVLSNPEGMLQNWTSIRCLSFPITSRKSFKD